MSLEGVTWLNNASDSVMTTSAPYDVINGTNDYVISEEVKERIIAISMIMACTVVGNLTLILILLCKRSRRVKRVNIFLINLAVGDLAVALFVNSTEILFLAFGDWVLGPVMCKVMVYIQMVCLASATNLLTAMTLDRYQVIVKPMETLAKRPRILLKIAIAWALSLVFPLPQLFIFVQYEGTKQDGTPRRICGSNGYTAPWQRKVYFTFTTIYILIVPMLIMLYCYARIIHVVWVRANSDALQHTASQQNDHLRYHHHQQQHQQRQQKQKRRKITLRSESAGVIKNCRKKTGIVINRHGNAETPLTKDDGVSNRSHDIKDDNTIVVNPSQIDEEGIRVNVSHQSSVKGAGNVRENHTTDKLSKSSKSRTKRGKKPSIRMSVRQNTMTSSKRRVLTMTLSVVMSFFICHTPYFVLTLIRIYSDYRIKMETGKLIGEFMVMVHSTLNPLLYGLFTLRQKHLKYLVSLVTCLKRREPTHVDETKGEMHCLIRRHTLSKPTTDGSCHCGENYVTNAKALSNHRTGSPSSLSTSASSSSTSLKPSILSRFRRKGKPCIQVPIPYGEREESSIGESLLYSNTDALDNSTPTFKDGTNSNSKPGGGNLKSSTVSFVRGSGETITAECCRDSAHDVTQTTERLRDDSSQENDAVDCSIVLANHSVSITTTSNGSNGDGSRMDKEHKLEEEEEIIPPVDFNSVPWEDEFIIGGLTRV